MSENVRDIVDDCNPNYKETQHITHQMPAMCSLDVKLVSITLDRPKRTVVTQIALISVSM